MPQETKRRRTAHDENTPARRPGGSRTPLSSSTNVLRSSTSTHAAAQGTPGGSTSTATARRTRRGTADENAIPPRATKEGRGGKASRSALGLGEAPAAAAVPGKTARRAALGQISEQAAQTRPVPVPGRPLPRPEPRAARLEPRRQNTAPLSSTSSNTDKQHAKAPPEAPAKPAPRDVPRTPLGSVRRTLFTPAAPADRDLSEAERERLAGLGATTKRTRPPPVTPRAQLGAAGRRRRLPPLPEPPTAQPAAGHPYSTHPREKKEKRKISVLEDVDACTTQKAEERWTPSPETHRTAVTERRLLRQAFAPEPEERFDAALDFELEVDLPELDLEDDAFLI